MGRPSEEKIQVCPFSSGISSTPGYANIHCHPSKKLDVITAKFRNMKARDEWYDDYCTSFCYRACVFYQALETIDLENEQ